VKPWEGVGALKPPVVYTYGICQCNNKSWVAPLSPPPRDNFPFITADILNISQALTIRRYNQLPIVHQMHRFWLEISKLFASSSTRFQTMF